MSIKTKPLIVKEIIRLSQEEGYTDEEIARDLDYTRVHVSRIRKENNIPTRNLNNRKDKRYICPLCKRVVLIRRVETGRICCDECLQALRNSVDISVLANKSL